MAVVEEMIMTMNLAQGVSQRNKNSIPYLLIMSDLMMEHLCVSFLFCRTVYS